MARSSISRRRFLAAAGALAATGTAAVRTIGAETIPAPPRPGGVRVGITVQQGASFSDTLALWQDAERLGFDSAFVFDHLMAASPGQGEHSFEAWTLLAALAARTERLRVGVLVTCSTFRHAAIVAKMAVTVDHASRGRLILGLGAGWLEREHVAYGIPFDTPTGRARRLVETVEVVRLLFTSERASFKGKEFSLKDAPFEPKAVQKPYPPILIGGRGPKVVQPLAARRADIWHFMVPGNDPPEVRRLIANFDRLCAEAGRDPRQVEKASSVDPNLLKTSPELLRQQIRTLREAGVRFLTLLPPAANDRGVLQRFAKEILPELRAS